MKLLSNRWLIILYRMASYFLYFVKETIFIQETFVSVCVRACVCVWSSACEVKWKSIIVICLIQFNRNWRKNYLLDFLLLRAFQLKHVPLRDRSGKKFIKILIIQFSLFLSIEKQNDINSCNIYIPHSWKIQRIFVYL